MIQDLLSLMTKILGLPDVLIKSSSYTGEANCLVKYIAETVTGHFLLPCPEDDSQFFRAGQGYKLYISIKKS